MAQILFCNAVALEADKISHTQGGEKHPGINGPTLPSMSYFFLKEALPQMKPLFLFFRDTTLPYFSGVKNKCFKYIFQKVEQQQNSNCIVYLSI